MSDILIVDDEESYRKVLTLIFEAEGYSVDSVKSGQQALDYLQTNKCNLVISDVRMPDMNGIQLLRAVHEISPDIGIILMTAFGTIETAREAFKLGADDFVQKPFHNEELKVIVKRTLEKQAIIKENTAFRQAQSDHGSIGNIVGNSAKMQSLFQMMRKVAREDSTILITGESGTGKELFARAIHDISNRKDKPFVAINCGAMPENLLEAELFGFMKGTFTGANQNRTGLFESANRGSIFLDEIGEMSPVMQVKMLRVLQEQRIRPIGATNEISIDTRVIVATNRNIKQMVDEGTFRQDLFYRLSVIPLHIPPLRERRDDIPDLVNHFITKFCSKSGKKINMSEQAMNILHNRNWEGNVRELEHTIERAVALTGDGEEVLAEYCIEENQKESNGSFLLPKAGLHLPSFINNLEKNMVEEAMQRMMNNQTRAAEILQIPVHAFRHLLNKHNLHSNGSSHNKEM